MRPCQKKTICAWILLAIMSTGVITAQTGEDIRKLKKEHKKEIEKLKKEYEAQLKKKIREIKKEYEEQMQRELEKIRKETKDESQKGQKKKAYMGIKAKGLSNEARFLLNLADGEGILVTEVEAQSPAQKAGIHRLDIILSIEGKKIASTKKLQKYIARAKIGQNIKVQLLRKGEKIEKEVVLGQKNYSKAIPDKLDEYIPFMTENEWKKIQKSLQKLEKNMPPEVNDFWKELEKKGKYYWDDLRYDPKLRKHFEKQLKEILKDLDQENYEKLLEEWMKGIEQGDYQEVLEKLLKKKLPLREPEEEENEIFEDEPHVVGKIGITVVPIPDILKEKEQITGGVLVHEIEEGSPAAPHLKKWDIILKIDEHAVSSPVEFRNIILQSKTKVEMSIISRGVKRKVIIEFP